MGCDRLEPSSSLWPADAFVGRAAILDQLNAALAHATASAGRCALVCGDQGIGKTRLLRRFAELAAAEGTRVLFAAGACEPGAPSFWPWIQVLRAFETAGLANPCELRSLLVGLDPLRAGRGQPAAVDLGQQRQVSRFRVFDTLTQALFAAARRQPLCLVLDDVHEADPGSCALLRHLLRELHDAPLFVLLAMRDDCGAASRAADVAALVQAAEPVIGLPGLTLEDVGELLALRLGERTARRVMHAVHTRTEGNPLFVNALLPTLAADGDSASGTVVPELPRSLRVALGARLAMLPERCRDTLRAAALLGRDLDVALLAEVCELPSSELEPQLERACAELVLVRRTGGNGANGDGSARGSHAFAHALLCELLESELDCEQRARLHRRAALALQQPAFAAHDSALLRLARHALAGATAAGERLALDAARRAAADAAARNAHEDEAAALSLALCAAAAGERRANAEGARAAHAQRAASERAGLLFACANALWRTGAHELARARYAELSAIAQRLGDAELFARAALAAMGSDIRLQLNEDQVALCEQALRALPEHSLAARTRLLAGLGARLCFSPEKQRGAALVREAERLGARASAGGPERAGALDPETELTLLTGRYYAFPAGGSLAERGEIIARIETLARHDLPPYVALQVRHWRFMHCLELGEVADAEQRLRRFTKEATRWGDPLPLWLTLIDQCTLAILRGRLGEAEQLVRRGFATGQRAQSPNARMNMLAQGFAIRRLQGRAGELLDALLERAADMAHVPEFRAVVAATCAELGRRDEAHAELERAFAEHGSSDWREASPFALCQLAETAARLGDAARAAALHERLLPFAQRCALITTGQSCEGSIFHYLGLCARASGAHDLACQHFEHAVHANAALSAAPALARSKHELAACLVAHGGACERAARLAGEALGAFERIGMTAWASCARALLARMASAPISRVTAAQGVPAQHRAAERADEPGFVREGEYWSLCFAGRRTKLRDNKGMRYLGALLANAGCDLHVLELIARTDGVCDALPAAQDNLTVTRSAREWDAPLDADSLRAYRRRAAELREALCEAEARCDLARAQLAREELAFLEAELGAQLRARHRPTERARKAVYNRIRQAITRIAHEHAALGRHLQHSVRTGTHCSYRAEPALRWQT